MENLIVVERKEKYQYKDIKSLIEDLINENYFNMSKEEQMEELEKKTVANAMLRNIKIVKIDKGIKDFDENAFVVCDEITYLLSMLKFNVIILLEKTDANIFGRYIEKDQFEDNYIILNKFADSIMKKYLKGDDKLD